jgi:hypothetical protein
VFKKVERIGGPALNFKTIVKGIKNIEIILQVIITCLTFCAY